jgi:hypothetical protein
MALQGGRLTARIVAVPLPQLIEQVGKLTGARVRWLSPKEETRVSMEFTDAPLPQALRQILGRRNFLLFYTSTGEGAKLSRIWISGTHQGSRQAGQPVLALGGRVPRELSRTALHSRDPSARLDAIRQLKWYVQTDRRGVTSVLSWLARRDPNPLVRQTVIGELARMK